MGLSDIFKVKEYKAQLEELIAENEKIKESITPEMQNAISLQEKIQELESIINSKNQEINNLNSTIETKKQSISSLNATISSKQKEIVVLDDEILVQEYGLYKPRYSFANALGYKERLATIRAWQKEMIKNKTAFTGNPNWTVNGSIQKGKKMVSDTQKLLLRAFNDECDELVSKVKYSNIDASLNKIKKSAETISKLGVTMGISLTAPYLNSKIQELQLAFEYQVKKQEEKEKIRAIKAQEREAAKLQREIAEQRKKAEKEENHYERALSDVTKQLLNSPEDPDLLNKKQVLEDTLAKIEKSLEELDYREANQRAGYVYIISNIGAFGENIYKIGMTRRLDPQERVDELGDASVPFKFDVHAMIFSDDAPALEAALHRAFEDKKVNMVNTRREFFNVTLDEIKTVVKNNFDKTVEFVDVADAEQYRISLRMKEQMKH
mgnify:FL=1